MQRRWQSVKQNEEKAGSPVSQKQPFSEEVEKMMKMKIGWVREPPVVEGEPSTLTLVSLLLFSSLFLPSLLVPLFPLVEREMKQLVRKLEKREKEKELRGGLWVWRWVWEEEGEQKEREEAKRSWGRLARQQQEEERQELGPQ